jgi:hypothetical protein
MKASKKIKSLLNIKSPLQAYVQYRFPQTKIKSNTIEVPKEFQTKWDISNGHLMFDHQLREILEQSSGAKADYYLKLIKKRKLTENDGAILMADFGAAFSTLHPLTFFAYVVQSGPNCFDFSHLQASFVKKFGIPST